MIDDRQAEPEPGIACGGIVLDTIELVEDAPLIFIGCSFQTSSAYWRIVRSLEKRPLAAQFRMLMRRQRAGSLHAVSARRCAVT